ncbi:MAG: hypothetical protein M1831_004438 [Alyxoria varia]|nr:MAG: hypothetical protein M1831_004438 [Alyxoria varia]
MLRQICLRRVLCRPSPSAHAIQSFGKTRLQLLTRAYSASPAPGSRKSTATSSSSLFSEDDDFIFSVTEETPNVPTRHEQAEPLDPLGTVHKPTASKPVRLSRNPRDPGDPEKAEANQSSLGFLRSKASAGNYHLVRGNTRRFIQKYRMRPNSELYSACILVNVSHERGSAAEVGELLREMREDAGIEWDRGICCDALKALAVHPDPFLRNEILTYMDKHWFTLSDTTWHDLVAGHIKERQLEAALETLEDMQDKHRVQVQEWLWDMLIYSLCDMGEVEEALWIMKKRVTVDGPEKPISRAVSYYLFDLGCSTLHYPTLAYMWTRLVEPNHVNPSTGQCMAVLTSASRRPNPTLATDVFRILTKRNTHLDAEHYELLLQSYLLQAEHLDAEYEAETSQHSNPDDEGDRLIDTRARNERRDAEEKRKGRREEQQDILRAPFTILSIMHDADLPVKRSTTLAFLRFLQAGGEMAAARRRTTDAFTVVRRLKNEKPDRDIPTAAVDVVIEGTVAWGSMYRPSASPSDPATNTLGPVPGPTARNSHPDEPSGPTSALYHAVSIYKTLHTLCSSGPSVHTFNALIHACANAGQKDGYAQAKSTAMFLAEEMLALKVKPNGWTYEWLVWVCLFHGATTAIAKGGGSGEGGGEGRVGGVLSERRERGKHIPTPHPATAASSSEEQPKNQEPPYESALRYHIEMRDAGWTPRRNTCRELVKVMAIYKDQRVWGLVEGLVTDERLEGLRGDVQEAWGL